MNKATLLILAAGMGSRYGGNKQIDSFGPNDETIMDYSCYDAIKAGFDKIVFIIREDLRKEITEIFEPRLKGKIEFDVAIQGITDYLPEDLNIGERTKPWGTGHAMLCAKDQTDTPFAIINADDFYGLGAFEKICHFLKTDEDPNRHAMVGYKLENTLSENGSVSRGICKVNSQNELLEVVEHTKIERLPDGTIVDTEFGNKVLDPDTTVSMNFWGFKPSIFGYTKEWFEEYSRNNINSIKAEFYIPLVMTKAIEEKKGTCHVFKTDSPWFGVTYPEDKEKVKARIRELISEGKYPENLW